MHTITLFIQSRADHTEVEHEINLWLHERHAHAEAIAFELDAGAGAWPTRVSVLLPNAANLPEETDVALVRRLRRACDVIAQPAEWITGYAERLATSRRADTLRAQRPEVTYDADGIRSNLPVELRARVPQQTIGSELAAFVGPTLGATYVHTRHRETGGWPETLAAPLGFDEAGFRSLRHASSALHYSDLGELWKHRAQPRPERSLLSSCNNDGWAATDDPAVVWHVEGLDFMSPYLNRYRPIDLDHLLGWAVDRREADIVLTANNSLLRKSHLAFYIAYEPEDLKPGWKPRDGIGAFTGWAVATEPTLKATPLGANNAPFRNYEAAINGVLGSFGSTRIEWALNRDLLLAGTLAPELSTDLRHFIGLLVVGLVLARAGYLAPIGTSTRDRPVEAIPAGTETARVELVLEGWSLLRARDTVDDFVAAAENLDASVYRASRGHNPQDYPNDAVRVEIETVASPGAIETIQQLANELKSPATWTQSTGPRTWESTTIHPRQSDRGQ